MQIEFSRTNPFSSPISAQCDIDVDQVFRGKANEPDAYPQVYLKTPSYLVNLGDAWNSVKILKSTKVYDYEPFDAKLVLSPAS